MANNFRLSGDIYVSEDGDDLNSGTSPDLPKKTMSAAASIASVNDVIVVGSGVYNESFNLSTNGVQVLADGRVIFDANSLGAIVLGAPSMEAKGVIIKNVNSGDVLSISGLSLFDCEVEDCDILSTSIFSAERTEFRNCNGGRSLNFNYCMLTDNCDLGQDSSNSIVRNTYADNSCKLNISSSSSIPLNNDIQGIVNVSGTDYRLYLEQDGSSVSPVPSEPDIIAVYPTIYAASLNFSQEPEFFNFQKRDFKSVVSTSPLLRNGQNSTNIGDANEGVGITTSDTALSTPIIAQDVILSAGDWIYDPAATSDFGILRTQPIKLSDIDVVINRINLGGNFDSFDSDELAGSSANRNVLSKENPTSGDAEANPARLNFGMRFSSLANPNGNIGADWPNKNLSTAGEFLLFPVNGEYKIDVNGKGSGDPLYDPVGSGKFAAKWVQLEFTILKGRLIL